VLVSISLTGMLKCTTDVMSTMPASLTDGSL
jgi:hypothetical protein